MQTRTHTYTFFTLPLQLSAVEGEDVWFHITSVQPSPSKHDKKDPADAPLNEESDESAEGFDSLSASSDDEFERVNTPLKKLQLSKPITPFVEMRQTNGAHVPFDPYEDVMLTCATPAFQILYARQISNSPSDILHLTGLRHGASALEYSHF